jgi:hypothetical protein
MRKASSGYRQRTLSAHISTVTISGGELMNRELEGKLVADYPKLFRCVYSDQSENRMCFGCECLDGWYQLIDGACKELNALGEDCRFIQIKEKFGTLRLYLDSATIRAWNIVSKYEKLSEHMCEVCGQDGKIRGGGWLKCLCEDCHAKT